LVLLAEGGRHILTAQVLSGSLVGNVTDPSGSGVPGATVRVIQTQTNESREVTTNDSGGYTLPTVPAGTYQVLISKGGFQTFTTRNIEVRLNTVVRVDATLEVGQISEQVEVTAQAAALQTDKADVHSEFTTQQMVNLPQPTRTYQGIVALMPGIAPPVASSGGTNNPGKSMQISANGTSRSGTTVRIDGVTDTNPWVQFFSTYVPSMEAIETVNVATTSMDAEQGLVNGAAINVQTKSGTNQWHGSAYEYNVNSFFKARPYFLPSNQTLPKLNENDFGGSLGGKIIKDKLFFFASYEGDLLRQGNTNTGISVPTSDFRNGNLSGSSIPIYDPNAGNANGTGRIQFAGNIVPANRISPIVQKLIGLIPPPNLPGIANNYFVNTPVTNNLHRVDTKVDWNVSSKFKLSGRVGVQPSHILQATTFGDILGGANNYLQDATVLATAVMGTYVASPNLVVDFNVGLTKAHQTLAPPSSDKRLGSDLLGIPGTNLGPLPQGGGMPQFAVTGFSTLGSNYPALDYNDPILQYTGNITWVKGRHNMRFGIDISQQHMNHQEVQVTSFTFNGGATALNGGSSPNQYNAFGDFLLGLPQSYANSLQSVPVVTLRTWQDSVYFRDQWQVNRKLTVSYGTRWEYYPVPHRADRGIESYNFASNQIILCGVALNPTNCDIQVSKKLFSPRIGIAYRPAESLVIRAGFSLNPEQINMYRDGLYSYPVRADFSASGASTYTPVGTLSAGIPVQAVPDISSGSVTLPRGASFSQGAILPNNFVRGYTESWNFTVQKEIGKGWVGQAAYVGTHTVHQHTRYNINYGQIGGGAVSQPFQKYGITAGVVEVLPYETMHYNSLQASLQRRFANGFDLQASYTRSKWIGTCCDDSGDGGPAIPIPQYTNLNRSLMSSDRPNNFRLSSIYELPFGPGKMMLKNGGFLAAVLGGWQLNGILSIYSGAPFSVTSSSASLNAPGSTQRADQVKPDVALVGSIASWFDPTAFAPVTTARFGTAGYNTVRGPGLKNLDFGLFRSFKMTERFNLQFRAEALNLTNTPHFSNPSGLNVSNATFNSDGTVRALNGFSQITTTNPASRLVDERFLRLGLRISF